MSSYTPSVQGGEFVTNVGNIPLNQDVFNVFANKDIARSKLLDARSRYNSGQIGLDELHKYDYVDQYFSALMNSAEASDEGWRTFYTQQAQDLLPKLDTGIYQTITGAPRPSGEDGRGYAFSTYAAQGGDPDALANAIGLKAQQDAKKNRPFYRKATATIVPLAISAIGSTLGAGLAGAAGLTGYAATAAGGAFGGLLSSVESKENPLLALAKGAGTAVAGKAALGQLSKAGLNPLDGFSAPESVSSESLLNAPASNLSGAPSAEALLSAPSVSQAGFSAGGISSDAGGSFLSNAISKIGDKMSPWTLLAGAGLLGGTIYSANKQADAAENAARQQTEAGQAAINSQERMLDRQIAEQRQARAESQALRQPYIDAGVQGLEGLPDLVNDPNAQAAYIQNNPFYESLANDAQQRILSNAAARGKVGSGGTAEALQNSLVLLGQDLLNQGIQQRQNLATLGANAASNQATGVQNSANNIAAAQGQAGGTISDLMTQIGNSQASGTIGAANAGTQGFNNLVNTALSAYGLSQGNLINL